MPGRPLLLRSAGFRIEGRKSSVSRGRCRGPIRAHRNGRHPVGAVRQKGEARGGNETWKRMGETVVSGGDEPTKVKIRGNMVLVPVTLVYGGNEVDVHLLLDTGAR